MDNLSKKLRYDNTKSVYDMARRIENECPDWWKTRTGNDILIFSVGDKVITTSKSVLKPGLKLIVKSVMLDSGYAKYFAGGVWHRQDDLIKLIDNQ